MEHGALVVVKRHAPAINVTQRTNAKCHGKLVECVRELLTKATSIAHLHFTQRTNAKPQKSWRNAREFLAMRTGRRPPAYPRGNCHFLLETVSSSCTYRPRSAVTSSRSCDSRAERAGTDSAAVINERSCDSGSRI